MTAKHAVTEKKIEPLEAGELGIESKATHQGFRDASCRNRIEEELDTLHDVQRRAQTPRVNSPMAEIDQDGDPHATSKGQAVCKE